VYDVILQVCVRLCLELKVTVCVCVCDMCRYMLCMCDMCRYMCDMCRYMFKTPILEVNTQMACIACVCVWVFEGPHLGGETVSASQYMHVYACVVGITLTQSMSQLGHATIQVYMSIKEQCKCRD
jgi:hypothetical protein